MFDASNQNGTWGVTLANLGGNTTIDGTVSDYNYTVQNIGDYEIQANSLDFVANGGGTITSQTTGTHLITADTELRLTTGVSGVTIRCGRS